MIYEKLIKGCFQNIMYPQIIFLIVLSSFLFTCQSSEQRPPNKTVSKKQDSLSQKQDHKAVIEEENTFEIEPPPDHLSYPFLSSEPKLNLTDLIPIPNGFQRIPIEKSSFAEWLRYLPVKDQSEKVRYYNGALKSNQNVHFAIINIDVGSRDLQQCADAVMRLKAEYNYSRQEYSKIHFNFTSGDKVAFDDWSKGKKPKINGNSVTFSNAGRTIDTSYPNFRKYMNMIFNYAGTMSLSKELKSVDLKDMRIGDVFIQGGFPGHAVLVIDMIQNEEGEKRFLLAQSYMPAQDFHVLKNYANNDDDPWYSLDFGSQLQTPEWSFSSEDLKRF